MIPWNFMQKSSTFIRNDCYTQNKSVEYKGIRFNKTQKTEFSKNAFNDIIKLILKIENFKKSEYFKPKYFAILESDNDSASSHVQTKIVSNKHLSTNQCIKIIVFFNFRP